MTDKPYPFTVQGQSREIASVISAVNDAGGIGTFYWEPAWLPVSGDSYEERSVKWEEYGSGWASSHSAEYDPDNAGRYYGGSSWDNQALFDFDGKALESLKTFALVRTGNELEAVPDAVTDTDVTINIGGEIKLPETVSAVYTDGSTQEIPAEWDEESLAAVSSDTAGDFTVTGKAGGMNALCTVHIVAANYVKDGSFEEYDYSAWDIENIDETTSQIDYQWKSADAHSGDVSLHFWGENGTKFRAEQTVADLGAGTYTLSAFVQGGWDEAQNVYIFVSVNGEEKTVPAQLNGWCEWSEPVISGIEVPEGAEVKVGIYVEAGAGSWGTIDDFTLTKE